MEDMMLAQTKKISPESAPSQHSHVAAESPVKGPLIDGAELSRLLDLKRGAAVDDIIRAALLNPVTDLTSNQGKRIRGQLVTLGYRLVSDCNPNSVLAAKRCRTCSEVVELIHAGSLVVDDIEDGSTSRRGKPALHIRYGEPIALNVGNWLYFWPFELVKKLDLPAEAALLIYERYHKTLLRAHFGQAVDLGVRIDRLPQSRVAEVCLAAMELKTGALMGFAMALGGAIGGSSERVIGLLDGFGRELGVALQMFDDLGNVVGRREPMKRYEDLMLCRPSWAWACAAKNGSSSQYSEFVSAAGKLPDARELESWIDRHNLIAQIRDDARQQLQSAYGQLKAGLESQYGRWSARDFAELRALGEEIAVAYE
jgi:geranylgeranyl pyrophosphate synthase